MNRLGFINPLLMLIGIIALAFTSGCVSPVSFDQSQADYTTSLRQETTIGQSFLARYDGIEAISVYLKHAQMDAGNLHLVINNNPDSEEILAESKLPVEQVSAPGYYKFQLDKVLPHSAGENLFFEIKLDTRNEVAIGTAAGDTYLHGSVYKNRIPADEQLAFQIHYDPIKQYTGLVIEVLALVGLTIIAIMLLIIPGWGVLSQVLPEWSGVTEDSQGYSLGEKIGLASGFSLVFYPILYLWTRVIGVQIGDIVIWIPFVVGLILIVFNQRKGIVTFSKLFSERRLISGVRNFLTEVKYPMQYITGIYILLCLLLLLTRFWPIRMIDYPMWGDSYQHTMIAQLLIDNNGLFDNWKPYADLTTFTYHFGFHSIVAAFQNLTRIPIERATLFVGQFLNLLAVLVLYPLASRAAKSQWAGITAIVIAGFLTKMPMYYVNWGRYTQLAGMVVLAPVIFLSWSTLDDKSFDWRKTLLTGTLLAGLALTHFRVIFFGLFFYIAYMILYLRGKSMKALLQKLFAIGLVAGVLFLPWFVHVYAGQILKIFASQISSFPSKTAEISNISSEIGSITEYLPALIWILFPIAISWGFWQRSKKVAQIALWWFLLLLATNPQWIKLPGAGIISNFTFFIAAYFPASLLVGVAVAWIIDKVLSPDNNKQDQANPLTRGKHHPSVRHWIRPIVVSFGILVIAILGSRQRINDVKPELGAMVTNPDQRAMEWIRNNSPENAKFLINSFSAFYDTTIVGSDGGWWIPRLTERQTNVPPINYIFEKEPWNGYRESISTLTKLIYSKGINHPDVLDELKSRNIEYVYVAQRQGLVNNPIDPYLDVNTLLSEGNFTQIYHQDRVWIFKIET